MLPVPPDTAKSAPARLDAGAEAVADTVSVLPLFVTDTELDVAPLLLTPSRIDVVEVEIDTVAAVADPIATAKQPARQTALWSLHSAYM
ncbi:MAG: hypothetical protein R3F19_26370 [Verrucomicrobiales bacterium]